MTAELLDLEALRKKLHREKVLPREQFQPEIPEWLVVHQGLARQIAAEGNKFMPGQTEFGATDDLVRAGIVEEAVFFGGGALTYRITQRGRQWLACIKPRR